MDKKSEKRKRFVIPGMRYLFALNGMLGFCVVYTLRVNINVAIVAMVNNTAVYHKDNTSVSDECLPHLSPNSTSDIELPKEGELIWSPKTQGLVLGAFYYGYCVSQIPGGRLAELYSGKWVFGIGTLITALLTLLTPLAVGCHVGLVIFIRVLEGLAQGVTMPAMNFMLSRWLPDTERGLLYTFIHSGSNVGSMVAMVISGKLCESDVFGGWPSAFYVFGIFGCFWFLLWCVLVTDTPLDHPFISKKELDYITSNQRMEIRKQLPPLPVKRILTSVPFWTLIIAQTCQDWSFYTLMTDLPTYFATILHFKIGENGFRSSLPHFIQSVVGLIVASVADMVIRKGLASTNFVRKFCNSVSGFGAAIGLICVCLSGCDVSKNMGFFIFSIAIGGFCYSGHELTTLDLSPEYAGTLNGIANTISNLTGFLTPLYVGILTNEKQTLHQWSIVFSTTSVLLTFATFVFIFFGTTEKQDWASEEPKRSILEAPELPSKSRKKYKLMD